MEYRAIILLLQNTNMDISRQVRAGRPGDIHRKCAGVLCPFSRNARLQPCYSLCVSPTINWFCRAQHGLSMWVISYASICSIVFEHFVECRCWSTFWISLIQIFIQINTGRAKNLRQDESKEEVLQAFCKHERSFSGLNSCLENRYRNLEILRLLASSYCCCSSICPHPPAPSILD
jgi:hypothetical protein